ncbi:unnamed protein product [Somion occarium]|uniref:lytic cellulose monooxygenase (C4-dehydrogenating) n=1 Tax=Somion occarium TaxID=3059160 RepID=A0ABP1DLL0_9APHY
MFSLLPVVAVALSVAGVVNGHGYVHEITVGGKSFPGFAPFTDLYESGVSRIVRPIPNDGPVTNVGDASLACNVGGEKPAKLVADAAAGSKVTFNWQNWPSDHLGPVSTYMASCNGDCTKFNPSGAKWFKIDAAGYDSSSKQWASAKLVADGASWTSTIPSSLAAGDYLLRHEIIALHSVGQPQFYPIQVKVTGGGNKSPSGSELVSIPGLYDSVQWPDIWSDGFNSFKTPGPAVFISTGGSSSDDNASSSAAAASSSAAPSPSSTKASSSPSSSPDAEPSSTPATSAAPASSPQSSSTRASSPSSTGRCRTNTKRHSRHASFAKRHH